MKLLYQRLIAATGGALWILLASSTAHAEDVELFLGDVGTNHKPNILLILDDSGSMDSEVESQIDYDPSITYDGTCDPNRVYWQETGWFGTEPPDSDECSSTDRWISDSALVCRRALDAFEVMDGGTYTDTFAQFHPSDVWWSNDRWDDIAAGSSDRVVECEDDWGEHGDGSDATEVYPRNGDSSNLFTSDESAAIRWGGWWGTGDNYTLYDGNYLNWINGPGASSTRLEIMQEVAVNLVNSVSSVNMGLMSFNNSEGGRVRLAIGDVDTERSSLVSEINSLNAENWTPLSETLYEAHQYFRGGSVKYGSSGDPDAFDSSDSSQYQTPMEFTCQKNHTVLLTDGEPTQDHSADSDIEGLSDAQGRSFSELTGNSSCDTEDYPSELSPDGGRCLDDLAGYMNKADLSGSLDGEQNVTTHTVGFFTDLPVLEQAASRGGGDYYTADDTASLKAALTAIITDILETQSTFVAPAVSINAYNQTRNLSDLYFSVFQPSGTAHWPGNLKKYRLRTSDGAIVDADGNLAVDEETGFFADSARSFWSPSADGPDVEAGGAANLIPDPRTVYTYLGTSDLTAASNDVSPDNSALTDDVLGTGSSETPSREEVIAYMNGLDAPDVDRDGVTDEPRHQMGDPLHARPATVIYGPDNSDGIIYFATNDGYLHAIDTETGVEQWSFVPEEFLSQQVRLFSDNATDEKLYGIDGSMAVQYQADRDSSIESDEKVYLFFGMRRGGQFYYGLDVSDPTSPKVLWQLEGSDLPGVGETWATPTPARINIDGVTQNEDNMVLVIAGGYDPSQDDYTASTDSAGNSIYIVDSESGDLLWHGSKQDADANFAEASGTNATMDYSMPAPVKTVDINSDGYADRIYAADMGGQVWRFDVFNGEPVSDLVTGGVIAQLGAAGISDPTLAETRRFYNAPDTAFVSTDEQTFLHVGIGSGYRAHPNDESTRDRFYAIRDYAAFTWRSQDEFNSLEPHVDSDFVDVADDIDADVPVGSAGWKYELRDGGWRGEKVLAEAMTFDGEVFFNTFRPGATGDGCNPSLGVTRQYRVSLYNGAPVTNLDGEVDADGDGEPDDLTDEDRYTEEDGSILSRTTVIFADGTDDSDPDNDDEEIVVGCTETDCSDLDFDRSPRRTFWTQENVE